MSIDYALLSARPKSSTTPSFPNGAFEATYAENCTVEKFGKGYD